MSMRTSCLLVSLLLAATAGCSGSSPSTGTGGATQPSTDAGSSPDTGSTPGETADSGSGPVSDAATGEGTSLSGTLGALGAVKPTVSSFVISNSGETLLYFASAPITCAQLKTSRWLGSVTAGAQVVEIVVPGAAKVGTVAVPPGEVNYAAGGKSSAYEVNATGGSITFTRADAKGVVEGTVTATYPSGSVKGTFHAEFCDAGQGF